MIVGAVAVHFALIYSLQPKEGKHLYNTNNCTIIACGGRNIRDHQLFKNIKGRV